MRLIYHLKPYVSKILCHVSSLTMFA